MKMTIDLGELFEEEMQENGLSSSSLSSAIKEAVIARVSSEVFSRLNESLEAHLKQVLQTEITTQARSFISAKLPELMDYEFTEVDSWGKKKDTFTVKNRILKAIEEQCTITKSRYESEHNAFTKLILERVSELIKDFKKTYDGSVHATFTRDALEYATKQLQERLKLPKD